MEKVFLLITGKNIKAYASLRRLAREAGLDFDYIKENLPIEIGRLRIEEVTVETRL